MQKVQKQKGNYDTLGHMRQVFLLIPAALILVRFSPFVQGGGFSMQVVLYALLACAAVATLFQILRHPRQLTVAVSKSEAAIMGFFGVALLSLGLSSLGSWSPVTSFLGVNGQDYVSFTFLLALFGYLVAGLLFVEKTERRFMVKGIAWSLILVLAIDLVMYVLAGKTVLAESSIEFGLLGALSAPIVYWLARQTTVFDRIGSALLGALALVTLTIVDLSVIWVLVLVASVGLMAGYLAEDRSHKLLAAIPAAFAAFVLIFLIFDPVIGSGLPAQVAPSASVTWDVAKDALGTPRAILGYGPGTFSLVFDAFRPEAIAESSFWNIRFAGSESFLLTSLITFGVLPLLAVLSAMIIALGGGWIRLVHRLKGVQGKGSIEAEILLLMVGLACILTPIAPSVLVLGLVAVLWIFIEQTPQSEIRMSPKWLSPKVLAVSAVVLVLSILTVHSFRLLSELQFSAAVESQHARSINETRSSVDTAASLMPINDAMYRNLAYSLLLSGVEELSTEAGSGELAARYFALSVDAAQKATRLSPKLATNWSMLGDVYGELIPVDVQAVPLAINSYEIAVNRAPTNPKYHLELAKLYLRQANALSDLEETDITIAERNLAINSAHEHLVRAQELRSKLAGVSYYLAQVYQQRGNLERATETLADAYAEDASDTFVALQYGVLLLQQDQAAEARSVLEALVLQDPSISNARWYLAYAYEQTGSADLALEQLEQIRILNPENVDLLKRIEEVRSQTVPFGPELPEPIIEG